MKEQVKRVDGDRELMRRVKAGDEAALDALIRRWRGPAEQYAARILQDAQAAEDAAQEAFARLYAARARYDERYAFSAYLYAIVKRVCVDDLRKRRRRPLLPGVLPDIPAESAEDEYLQRTESLDRLHRVAELEGADKRLLLGFALEGKSCRELARELGMSEGQVRVRLHRVRKRLRKGAAEPNE